ncbi:sensor histidine kinase [Streptomyces peucetius]|uniref:histidine kinase n=1 Tax=Streptomyces peucetius TaxID=1950 RepID=A0ABY6I7T3_STRPE|nr:histidine kinase [Streptomyces peucetius]UYQ63058.1 histidine kinase [Streptomyces peucetius]
MAQQNDRPSAGPAQQGWATGAQPLTGRLHRLTERIRSLDRRRPLLWDLHVTGVCLFAALVDAAGGWRNVAFNDDVPVWLVLLMSLGFTVPLLWRRRHPLAALLVMLPFSLANAASGAHLQASFLQMIAVWNIALRLPLRTLVWSFCTVLVPLAVGATAYPVGSWDQQFVPMLYSFALVALLGLVVRSRQEYMASLVERAKQLEVERDQQAQLAAAAERTRIAREMHDIIGHNLSVITGLADGGAYAAAQSPQRATQALEAIGTTSRQALTELRRLLDVLRDEAATRPVAELAPQPALTDLDRLVEGVAGAGLPVDLTVEGSPGSLPAGKQLTVYRVVQEALTNSLKHGGPNTTATVDVRYAADEVTVTVTDTGRPRSAAPAPATGAGRGLTGMRERTALYGGTLEAGPLRRPGGGWRVHLCLPKETDQ